MDTTQIMRFQDNEEHQYRVMAHTINNEGDMELYVEMYLYDTTEGEPVWVKIEPDIAVKYKMTIEQTVEILELASAFINEHYYMIEPARGHICEEP